MSVPQRLERAGSCLEKAIFPAARVFDYAAMVLIVGLIGITISEIILRKVFLTSIPGNIEIQAAILGVAASLTFAIAEYARGHISIDAVVSKLSRRARAAVNTAMYVFYLTFTSFLTYAMLKYGIYAFNSGRVTLIIRLPLFPFFWVLALCCLVLSLMVLAHFLLYLAEASKK